jgi:hypothetical protein
MKFLKWAHENITGDIWTLIHIDAYPLIVRSFSFAYIIKFSADRFGWYSGKNFDPKLDADTMLKITAYCREHKYATNSLEKSKHHLTELAKIAGYTIIDEALIAYT